MYVCLHAPGNLPLLIECARAFSPHIEENPPDSVIFDARGLETLHGPPANLAKEIECRIGIPASIAIASNPDTALHAARGFRGVTVIAAGKEAEAIASLPLNLLRGTPETAELLHLWGIHTFGDFGRLPPLGVAARLGEEGIHLQRLARGEGYRRLQPMHDPLEFETEMDLDYAVEELEPLSFILARLLNEVCARLSGHSLATNEIRLHLTLENAPVHETVLRLPVPMQDPRAFLKMLQLELNSHAPTAPVVKVHLRAEPVKPRRAQQGLFVPSMPEPEKLELTVARIKHLVGADRVGSPELSNTHRPDAYTLHPLSNRTSHHELARANEFTACPAAVRSCEPATDVRLSLRRYRPPRHTQVLVVNHQPIRIISPSVSGRIVMAKGPWRTSGEWWKSGECFKEDAWNRDEWDVALESGALYRLFEELDSRRWFIEGSYD
jgi:protein ImuB